MRRALAWLFGGFALLGFLSRRRRAAQPAALEPDPAEALRAKLAESRAVVEEQDSFQEGETPVDEADPEERRRRVHEAGRAAAERMRGPEAG